MPDRVKRRGRRPPKTQIAARNAFDLDLSPFIKTVVASIVYSLVGVVVFALSFVVIKLVTPFSIRKEIEQDHNTALAIVIGSIILGIALIISAAIHG